MIEKFLKFVRKQWILLLLSGLSLVAYGGMVMLDWRTGTLRDQYTPQTITWAFLAFFTYLALLVFNEGSPIPKRWLWGGAILFRLLLLFTTPTLSDDIYRYLWDGYVANEGVSPYAYAIDAPELDYLDNPQRTQANNSWMASPYLPAAQAVFYGVTAVFPLQSIFMQAVMVIFDLTAAWLLGKLLLMAALPARRLFIYLWNPLVIIEVAHGAHVDAWMVLLAVGAVFLGFKQLTINQHSDGHGQIRRKLYWLWSPLLLSLGTLTKILPALLLPVLFWLWNWRQRLFYGLVLVLLLIPFGLQAGWGLTGELNGRGLFGALRIYGSQWIFNSGLFHWLAVWLGKQGISNPVVAAKGLVGVVFVLLLTAVWLLARTRTEPRPALRLMSIPLMGYVLLTPTLHPWYTLILLAFVPFLAPADDEPRRYWLLTAPWIYLSGALIFSYLTYLDPLHHGELEWVRQLEWIPVMVLLLAVVVMLLWELLSNRSVE